MISPLNSIQSRESQAAPPNGQRALMLISGSVNYYYDNIGKRMAEALRSLGFAVDVATLRQYRDRDYDWCFIGPLLEVCVPLGNIEEGMRLVERILARVDHSAMWLLECVQTQWFVNSWKLFKQAKLQTLLDLGLHSQYDDVPRSLDGVREVYRFAYNGLTNHERNIAESWLDHRGERPIPWAFVGHAGRVRARFVKTLLDHLDRDGFVYMPGLTHITEDGPHMNTRQMQDMLEHTRYFIWRTHHDYFYMESERFRGALLAGAVPIKVLDHKLLSSRKMPFAELMPDEGTFAEKVRTSDFETTRKRFIDDYMALPLLENELMAFIQERTGALV
jgi:hypothetical protein